MNPEKPYRFLFSAGGTGGHIFPALAVAEALKQRFSNSEFLFIGAAGRMEMEKVPKAGFKIHGLNISGINRSNHLKNLLFPFKLIGSLIQAGRLIRSFKPEVAVGFGGFASGPALYVASTMRIPTLIQEQNSFPGVTNRLLGSRVDRICTVYDEMSQFFPKEKIVQLGNPIRKEIEFNAVERSEAAAFFGLSPQKSILLIFGGSQGAKAINESILSHLSELVKREIQVIWQTGKSFAAKAEKLVKENAWPSVKVLPFIDQMNMAYAAADLVVCRSGAISISELASQGKATIFVPLPTAAEDHQFKNAHALERQGAAQLVLNSVASKELVPAAIQLIQNPAKCQAMGAAIRSFHKPNSAESIANEIIKLIDR